jgi:acetyl-CoA carboxylase carboxyltransferase component
MDPFFERRLTELNAAREKNKMGGGPAKIEKHHGEGKLTARERINILLDPDSFYEINPLIGHHTNTPGDGIVTGGGLIDGRKVFVYSQDRTVQGGSIGLEHGTKMYECIERALEMRVPLIGLNDSPGARAGGRGGGSGAQSIRSFSSFISDKHGGSVFYPNTQASGIIPQISAILGTCAGISVYSPALTDFVFMVDGTSHMMITGPAMVKVSLGEDISKEDLGSAKVHAQKSGVCDKRFKTEEECLKEIRRLLSFLPLNCDDNPPIIQTGDDPKRSCEELYDLVPDKPSKAFDVKKLIRVIVDKGDFFEVKPEFAGEIVTGFSRLNGKTVGIVANNSMVRAGSLTVDSSDKQARFIRFCDCFNIPILILVDTPAYMPGSAQEHAGIIRHGAKVLYALCESVVPRITLVLRKAYGGGNLGMSVLPGLGTDLVLYWPTMEIGVLGVEQTVTLFYGMQEGMTKEKLAEKIEEYRNTTANPIIDASFNVNVHDVVTPAETRAYLIRAFEMLEGKKKMMTPKRHGNIPM